MVHDSSNLKFLRGGEIDSRSEGYLGRRSLLHFVKVEHPVYRYLVGK